MACCFLAAFIINRIVAACEILDPVPGDHEHLNVAPKSRIVAGVLDATEPSRAGKIHTTFSITGLECSACANAVESALFLEDSVELVRVSLAFGEVFVVHDSIRAPRKLLQERMRDLGYDVDVGSRSNEDLIMALEENKNLRAIRQSMRKCIVLCSVLVGAEQGQNVLQYWLLRGIIAENFLFSVTCVIALLIQYCCAFGIHQTAWQMAMRRRLTMDSLISLSMVMGIGLTIFNILISSREAEVYFQSVSNTAMVVLAGKYLQAISRRESHGSLAKLLKLKQPITTLLDGNQQIDVPTSILQPKDVILIRPYTIVPCDAYVLCGSSSIDESLRTGESMPVLKNIGSDLWGGTRNGSGSMKAVVRTASEDSSLELLIDRIRESTGKKSESSLLVDQWNQYFVSLIILVAALAFLTNYNLSSADTILLDRINRAARSAMTVLMAACPCSLGLSAPSAVMAGIDVAWKRGILISSGPTTLDKLTKVTHVVMDKTGTLTSSHLEVHEIFLVDELSHDWSLYCILVCASEEQSATSHPISKAIFQATLPHVRDHWLDFRSQAKIKYWQPRSGRGVTCEIQYQGITRRVCLGNAKYLEENGVSIAYDLTHVGTESLLVYSVLDGVHIGHFILKDIIKTGAKTAIDYVKNKLNLTVQILTGDTEVQALRVSSSLGIDILASGAVPEEKFQLIRDIQARGGVVAMVGDGINDAPALVAADVGIMVCQEMSCSTTGGQVSLVTDDLSALIHLFDIANQTMWQIKANTLWAMGYNIIAIVLSLNVIMPSKIKITPTTAAAMMSASSVIVSIFSLRMRSILMERTRKDVKD